MANVTNYKNQIVQHLKDTLADSNSGLGYNVTKFWATTSPQALFDYIKGRLGTANGSVFVRIGDVDHTPIDTQGLMYNSDFTAEIIVASNRVSKEDQLPDSDRFTDKMLADVRNEILINPLQLQGRPQRFVLGKEVTLFRTDNADAQLLKAKITNINIEF